MDDDEQKKNTSNAQFAYTIENFFSSVHKSDDFIRGSEMLFLTKKEKNIQTHTTFQLKEQEVKV